MSDLGFVGRIALGALMGFIIGWEREHRGSSAGDRTFSLVTLGSAAFTAVGVENFPQTAEKLIAGVVTGIGFLGAGLIMRGNEGDVRGLTTAASLWASASVGILAGAGEPLTAGVVMLLVLVILESPHVPGLRRLQEHPARRSSSGSGGESPDSD